MFLQNITPDRREVSNECNVRDSAKKIKFILEVPIQTPMAYLLLVFF
jgi:hypothetical protein